MKCFNHHDRDAFGICKACGKALCLECLDTTDTIVKCKDNEKCSIRAKSINKAYSNIDAMHSKATEKLSLIIWSLFIIAGVIGIFSTFLFGLNLFALILSIIFIFMGVNSIIFINKTR